MFYSRLIAVVLLVFVGACAERPNRSESPSVEQQNAEQRNLEQQLEDFRQAIRAKYDMKEAAFAANDVEPILTRFYADTAISTGPDGTTIIGRAELRPAYEEVIGSAVKIDSFKTVLDGNTGWDWVNFHVTPPPEAGEEPFTFKMLFLWQKLDGEWWSQGEMYVVGRFAID